MIHCERPAGEHIWQLALNMRDGDRDEVKAMTGDTPITALIRSCMITPYPVAVMNGDEVLSIFGVAEPAILAPGYGIPWFLANKNAHHFTRAYAELVPPVMEMYRGAYTKLSNYVDARNTRSVRWLKRLGFTLDAPVAFGVEDRPFHRFWMEI